MVINLNKSQQDAVEYTDGPLLIVAGAGTGKTTVVTEKIVHLIKNCGVKPEEILGLTFTDNSAEEMQERVDAKLDIGYTDMQISTFHGFCQRILETYGLDIGISNEFKLFTDTDAWLMMKEKIYEFDLDYYRPISNPTKHIYEFLKHFSKCKDELIGPEDYLKHAEDIKLDKDEVNQEERSRLTEIANAYHQYNKLLLDSNALDFGDLIFYTVKLLEKRPNILKSLQERFKYILVDEFQDVNWSQYHLVRLLAGECQLTVVGDDDQSIYAFRGASVSNILRFKEDFPDSKEIVLTENYRSGQKILDEAYKLIQNNNPDRLEEKLKINKRLKAYGIRHTGVVEHLSFDSLDREVAGVVQKICEISEQESVVLDDIAILVRANAHAEPFINALEKAGIPYEFLASSGLYRQPIVLDCFNFLKIITNYYDSTAIYRLLRMPFLQFKENDLQKLTSLAKRKSTPYYEALKRASEFGVSAEGIVIAEKLISLIHSGMQKARDGKPTAVLYEFLESSGYLTYLTHEEEKENRKVIRGIYHLKQFLDFISRYEESIPDSHVSNFVEHFDTILVAGDEGKLYQPTDTPDSVNIMTVHGAKGLEFKHVFLVNLVEQRFPSRRRTDAIQIPLELIKEQLPEGDSHFQEERRLFYVAMTRAKENLYLTSAEDYGGVRKKKISRFLDELGYGEKIQETRNKKQEIDIRKSGLFPQRNALRVSVIGKEKSKSKFQYQLPKSFSFSQIRSYQTCPYQYKLSHILKIPAKGSASFSFGSSIHNTLQMFYERVRELNSVSQGSLFDGPKVVEKTDGVLVPTLDELYEMYDKKWISDWYKDKRQREDYYKQGKEILKVFYTSEEDNWNIPVGLETFFRIKVGDYLIGGRIDRVDQLEDGTLEIIDYKTGKSKEKLTADDKGQLLIYQIAAQSLSEYRNIGETSKLTFFYINDNLRVSFLGKEKELDSIQEKIIKTIDNIHAGEFKATPSKFVCARCDYKDICEYRI